MLFTVLEKKLIMSFLFSKEGKTRLFVDAWVCFGELGLVFFSVQSLSGETVVSSETVKYSDEGFCLGHKGE